MMEKYLSQISKINQKVDLETEFPDWDKSVQFNITDVDKGAFYFVAKGGKIAEFGEGTIKNPDVSINGTDSNMSALFNGETTIVGAVITKQLSVDGAIGDALGAKVLLEAVRVY